MIDLQTVRTFVYENFDNVTTNGTHFHARCPLCGDSKISRHKKRFHLDYKNGRPVWHCFNCGASGGFISIYCQVKGISPEQAYKEIYKYDSERLKNQLKKPITPIRQEPIKETFNTILEDCAGADLPVDTYLYDAWMKMLENFRKERMIPETLKLYYAYQGDYRGRIIIPIYEGEDIIYFQGRRIPKTQTGIVKYKNPVAEKSLIIHNKENFERDKYIIVTEGLIDAAMIGNQGTTMLGVEVADLFMRILLELTDVGVIIAYDNDEPGIKALKKFLKENKYRKRVKYFLMPDGYKDCKDINNIRVEYKIGDLYNFVVTHSKSYVATSWEVR